MLKEKNIIAVLIAVILMSFVCPQHTLAKEKPYLGHLYKGKMKKGVPCGEGTITIGNYIIEGTFEGNKVTNAKIDFNLCGYYTGDVVFDETDNITLQEGGVLTLLTYKEPFFIQKSTMNITKPYIFQQGMVMIGTTMELPIILDQNRNSVPLRNYNPVMYALEKIPQPILSALEYNKSIKAYASCKVKSALEIGYDDLRRFQKFVLNPPKFEKNVDFSKYTFISIERKPLEPGIQDFLWGEHKDTLSVSWYSETTYGPADVYGDEFDYHVTYSLRGSDGSILKNDTAYIKYPDGDTYAYIRLTEPRLSHTGELYGTLITKDGYILHGARPNEMNEIYNETSLEQPYSDKTILDFFMMRNLDKPLYEVEYISHPKYFNAKLEDSPKIEAEIKHILEKYPHKEKIGILCTTDFYKGIHHASSGSYLTSYGEIITPEEEKLFNGSVVGEYENGHFTFANKILSDAAAKLQREQQEIDAAYERAAKNVRVKLCKKYNAKLVDNCFHFHFKGASKSLVYDFINAMKPIVDNQIVNVWKDKPSYRTVQTYGSGIECHVVQKGPLKSVLIVRGGKVIDQLNAF